MAAVPKVKRTPTKVAKADLATAIMDDLRRNEIVLQFQDDVVAALSEAFADVLTREGWGKRDLAAVCGIDESTIGHILAGRRRNLELETVALLARAMRRRPELTLVDVRPVSRADRGGQGFTSNITVQQLASVTSANVVIGPTPSVAAEVQSRPLAKFEEKHAYHKG